MKHRIDEINVIIERAGSVLLFTIALSMCLVSVTVQAGTRGRISDGIRAEDAIGNDVIFDDDMHTSSAGPVVFVFDSSELSEGEIYVYDDGSTINPVAYDGHIMYPEKSQEIMFFKKTAGGELISLHDGMLSVDFVDGIYEEPEVEISEDEYGAAITVWPTKYSHVYADIRGRKNGVIEEITERTEFHLEEDGIYQVLVYSEDGMGHRTYADIDPRIVIDRTAPVMEEASLESTISSSPIEVKLGAYDEVSGLKAIYVQVGDEDPILADSIEIEAPFRGEIYYWAVDNMGNSTDKYCLGNDIIVDDVPPVIAVGAASMDAEKLEIMLSVTDDTAGVRETTVSYAGKVLYRGQGMDGKLEIDISDMPYGSRTYMVQALDYAGNAEKKSFTVTKQDGIPPELEIKGASDQGIYGKDVSITIEADDDSGGNCELEETITRYDLSGAYVGESRETRQTLTFNQSGVYVVKVSAKDDSGNETRRSVAFAIDKDAPIIRGLMGLRGSKLKSFMMDLTEGVATDDSLVQTKILLNGMDYTGEEVTKTGNYVLQIMASDEFGNTATEDVKFEIRK